MTHRLALVALLALAAPALAADPGPWATYRGNPQRTGNTDGKPGPATPAVLWAVRSQDHFVASPVPVGDKVLLSGLGGFNRPTISLFPLTPAGAKVEPVWSKTAPVLKLASVSSAAHVADKGLLVFGDGMHQDSGGLLHCVTADGGRPVWQLPLPGDLVHLEGGPTVADGRVYTGGGAAGVVCVELEKAVLDGKEVDPPTIAKLQEAKWKELQEKFEKQKKADPDFAIPPSEDQLLRPAPKKVWQVGEKKWHVDAAVNVSGGKVLVPTSFLDKEKVGERALVCLDAATGVEKWKAPLVLNPWGGASVAGDTVVVPGSSVGYYFNEIKGAKGDLTALDLATGKVKWKKDLPGGVVGAAAVAGGQAVCAATDGKVRAFKLADGDRAWLYDAKAPVFAPPAVAGGVVYVADLLGTVHAIDAKTGAAKWTFPLPKETPGMAYGGVTVHGGKLVVATCNLEGPFARRDTTVVVLGSR